MEKINKLLKNKKIYIFLGISMIFLGAFILPNYTQDSYLCFHDTWREPFNHFLSLGRISSALFWLALSWSNYKTMSIVSGVFAIIELAISMYVMYLIINKMIKNEKVSILTSIIIILNIFIIELFVWYEKCMMVLSVLASVIAIYFLQKAITENKKINYLYSFMSMTVANISYQGTVGIFLTLATILIIKYSKNIKEFIKNNIIVLFIYGLPAVIDLLYIKIFFGTNRVGQTVSILSKIKDICTQTSRIILDTYKILPKYIFAGFIMVTIIMFLYKCIRNKENYKKKLLNIFFLIYVIIVNVIVTVLPQIFQNYVSILPRNAYSLAALPGIIILLIYILYKNNKTFDNIVFVGITILLCFQWYNFISMTIDNFKTNYMDFNNANMIAKDINKYEEETGNTIKEIYVCKDASESYAYEGIRPLGDGNLKAFTSSWGTEGIMEEVLHRQLTVKNSENEEYNKYFKSKDWNHYSNEQLIFNKDVLYLGIY